MNAFSAIAIIYSKLTIASGSLLYLTLKEKIDSSAKHFLIAEFFTAIGSGMIGMINIHAEFQIPAFFLIINFLFLASEISILFSIRSLTRLNINKPYLLALGGAFGLTLIAEAMRSIFSVVGVSIVMNALQVCVSLLVIKALMVNDGSLLRGHRFLNWFKGFEFGILMFWTFMLLTALMQKPEVPRGHSNFAILVYSLFITMSVFRFISYIGFRITWLGLNEDQANPLNQNLAHAIKEKNTLSNKLIASNRIIGISALARTLAHELSQPLTAITLQADSSSRELNKSGIGNERLKNSLADIQQQSVRLIRLIQNLRKLFSSKSTEFEYFKISNMCNEVFEIIEPDLLSKNIQLMKNISTEAEMYGDAIQLQQVLINLINNAADSIQKSNQTNGVISISISDNTQSLAIQIDDNGSGIDPQIISKVFDLHQTTKTEGLGVGLWLCQNIINAHNGTITATNLADGGARFTVELPLKDQT